jgi:hypothetical protein
VSIDKAVDDLSPIEKDHLFTVLEEKLVAQPIWKNLFARRQLRQLYHRLEPCNGGSRPI